MKILDSRKREIEICSMGIPYNDIFYFTFFNVGRGEIMARPAKSVTMKTK